MEDTYLLIGNSEFFILEKKLQDYSTSKIKDGYVAVCSGPKDVINDYIKKYNIPKSAIKNFMRI